MVACDGPCGNWFHFKCVAIAEEEAERLETYLCNECVGVQQGTNPEATANIITGTPNDQSENQLVHDKENEASNLSPDRADHRPASDEVNRTTQPLASSSNTNNNLSSQSDDEDTEEEEIPRGHSIVNQILKHKRVNGKLKYHIRWKGFDDNHDEWIWETNLASCYDILKMYKEEHGLGEPQVKRPWVGASSIEGNAGFNENNWVSVDRILECSKSFATKTYQKEIQIKEFHLQVDNQDTIYLITVGNHCLTGLYLHDSKTIYIADGGNIFIRSKRTQDIIKEQLPGLNIKPLEFNQQKAIDFCGSSAVALAVEFRRIYCTDAPIPEELKIPRSLQERVTNLLHKEPSTSIKKWNPVRENLAGNKCPKCGKVFNSSNRSPYLAHVRMCAANRK